MRKERKRLALPAWALTASSLLIVTASTNALGQPQATAPGSIEGPRLAFQIDGFLADDELSVGGTSYTPLAVLPARPFQSAGGVRSRALDCLTAAVYYEARSEGEAGQRAVAQVVLNRVRHPAFPNSVCGVVYQGSARRTGCQFTFTCDGSMRRRQVPWAWAEARRIAEEALAGSVYAPVGHSTHYHTNEVRPYWAPTLTRVASVGAHIFYRWRGMAGEPQSFTRLASAEAGSAVLAEVKAAPAAKPAVRIHVGSSPPAAVRVAAAREEPRGTAQAQATAEAGAAGFPLAGLERRIGPAS